MLIMLFLFLSTSFIYDHLYQTEYGSLHASNSNVIYKKTNSIKQVATVPNRVSNADRTSVNIDLAGVKAKFAHVCYGNDTESLIDLPQCNVVHADSSLLQCFRNRQRRC